MVRITDPERSRSFYEALGFEFERDMDIVRNGELEMVRVAAEQLLDTPHLPVGETEGAV